MPSPGGCCDSTALNYCDNKHLHPAYAHAQAEPEANITAFTAGPKHEVLQGQNMKQKLFDRVEKTRRFYT